jgi:hypothetical protein
MNWTLKAFGLIEHNFTGWVGFAKLSISEPFVDGARTKGSSAATGIDEHDTITFGGLDAGDAGAWDGEALGLGVADGVGEGLACDTVASEGEGVEARWPVGLGVPHADMTTATAIAMPIRSRLMYQQR